MPGLPPKRFVCASQRSLHSRSNLSSLVVSFSLLTWFDWRIWLTFQIVWKDVVASTFSAVIVSAAWKCWVPSTHAHASAEAKGLAFPYGSGARFSFTDPMGPTGLGNYSEHYTASLNIPKTSLQVSDEKG